VFAATGRRLVDESVARAGRASTTHEVYGPGRWELVLLARAAVLVADWRAVLGLASADCP
jgi:hypothetical protein